MDLKFDWVKRSRAERSAAPKRDPLKFEDISLNLRKCAEALKEGFSRFAGYVELDTRKGVQVPKRPKLDRLIFQPVFQAPAPSHPQSGGHLKLRPPLCGSAGGVKLTPPLNPRLSGYLMREPKVAQPHFEGGILPL